MHNSENVKEMEAFSQFLGNYPLFGFCVANWDWPVLSQDQAEETNEDKSEKSLYASDLQREATKMEWKCKYMEEKTEANLFLLSY